MVCVPQGVCEFGTLERRGGKGGHGEELIYHRDTEDTEFRKNKKIRSDSETPRSLYLCGKFTLLHVLPPSPRPLTPEVRGAPRCVQEDTTPKIGLLLERETRRMREFACRPPLSWLALLPHLRVLATHLHGLSPNPVVRRH
jgi:hypothetical protein